jgi:hypothetical protein
MSLLGILVDFDNRIRDEDTPYISIFGFFEY